MGSVLGAHGWAAAGWRGACAMGTGLCLAAIVVNALTLRSGRRGQLEPLPSGR